LAAKQKDRKINQLSFLLILKFKVLCLLLHPDSTESWFSKRREKRKRKTFSLLILKFKNRLLSLHPDSTESWFSKEARGLVIENQ
jgi:hypothetical protein